MTRQSRTIVRFLLPVAAFFTFGAPSRAQTPNPQDFDIAGIRLGITVEQAKAAILAYNPTMTITVKQSASQIGPGTFTSIVAGTTGSASGNGDGILVAFTETQGNKAYMISRVLHYENNSPASVDVLMQQITAKYGKPSYMTADPAWSWATDPTGSFIIDSAAYKRNPTDPCGNLEIGYFLSVGQFAFPYGPTAKQNCGVGLIVLFGDPKLSTHVQEVLVDGQLESANLAAIKKVEDDKEAERLQQLKDKTQQQSPF
jgi:hypothetical protein